jgi:tRNA uridine 5-carboxymethylaminomethyl modification enzyme
MIGREGVQRMNRTQQLRGQRAVADLHRHLPRHPVAGGESDHENAQVIGRELGLIDDQRWAAFCTKRDGIEREEQRLKSTWVRPNTPQGQAVVDKFGTPLSHEYSLLNLLARPEVDYAGLIEATGGDAIDPQVAEQVEIKTKYAGYIDRQQDEIARLRASEDTRLPVDIDYTTISGLSKEIQGKLGQTRPETLGQASRIPGVTPAAISLLLIHLKKRGAGRELEQSA